MKRFAWILLFALMAAAIGWLLARPSPDAGRVAKLERELLEAKATITDLRVDLAETAKLVAKSPPSKAVAAAAHAAEDPQIAEANAPKKPAKTGNAFRDMMTRPGMKEAIKAQQKGALSMQYAGLFRRFDLTPEEKDHFEKLLLDRKMSDVELGLAVSGNDITDAERTELTAKHQAERKASDEAIRQFLNDDEDWAAYQEWEDSSPERMQLEMFGRSLFSASDHPLTEDQEAFLVSAMVEARKAPSEPGTAPPTNMNPMAGYSEEQVSSMINHQKQTQQLVLEKSSAFLTPEQMETLRQFQEQQLSMMETGLKMSTMMMGTGEEP